MSFSASVKDELSHHVARARHCQIAELAAILGFCGEVIKQRNGHFSLKISTENVTVARKVFTLFQKTFNIVACVSIGQNMKRQNVSYLIVITKPSDVLRILKATKQIGEDGSRLIADRLVDSLIIGRICCRRAFLRGTFLCAGSMSDPGKAYHFEIVSNRVSAANQVCDLICSFGMDAKVVPRKKTYVVYLKEGSQIVDILNIMEAHIALMELENIRILKEVRNSINRKVNCETANISKTVSAAVKQVKDIEYLRDSIGLGRLPEGLEEIALVRLSYPEATLKELGELVTPALGKSGVNHRLRRISEITEKVRLKQGGAL